MTKLLAVVAVLAFAVGSFAVTTVPTITGKDSLMIAKRDSMQAAWQAQMAAEKAKLDSVMTADKAAWTAERAAADSEQQKFLDAIKAGKITKASLDSILAARRVAADSAWQKAIAALKQFKDDEIARIDSARADLKAKLAARQGEAAGGISVALTKIQDAIADLQAKEGTVTGDKLTAIQALVSKLQTIETKLAAKN